MTQFLDKLRHTSSKRIKTPTLLQVEAVECGAATLGIILRYYGKFVPLEELRVACGVSRDGSNAANIVKAARRYGMEARGVRRNNVQDLRELSLPVILFWEFNHFLVLEGFGPDSYLLNDPASGPRSVTAAEFDESYTGVVLLITPGPDFQPSGAKFDLVKALRARLTHSQGAVAFVLIASLLLLIPGLLLPIFLRVFVDDILIGGRPWLNGLLIGLALMAVLRAGLTWLQQLYLLRLETRLALSSSSQFMWHLLRLPVEFFTQRYTGDIAMRVQLNDRVAQLVSGELATTLIDLLLIVFYALLMLQYDAALTLISIAIAAVNIAALQAVSRRRVDASHRLLHETGRMMGTAVNSLEIIETVKATGAETAVFARWAGFQAKASIVDQRINALTQTVTVIPPLLLGINTAAVLLLGGQRVLDGTLTAGMLLAFYSLMLSFNEPTIRLVNLGTRLQEAEGSLARLDDVLNYPVNKSAHANDSAPVAKLDGAFELRNVTFGYSPLEAPLIEDFSLTVKPGQWVALVGKSGSGKSTVARLVAGLYEAWQGEIVFDGRRRADISPRTFNTSVAMVDQDIRLFTGTIRDNLTLWNPTIPKSQIIQAAKDAAIHGIISTKSGSYDHALAENGRNFSGGERQRLEIARALVQNPTLLIFDEATSALDPLTEQAVIENVRLRGCACLVVAHRLSTIRDCDEIIVLEHGKIVQRGVHEELIRQEGLYAELVGADRPAYGSLDSLLSKLT